MTSSNAASRLPIQKKIILVGDGGCGKTYLLTAFRENKFLNVEVGPQFDEYVADINVDNQHVELTLIDTPGQEDYDRLRPLSYSNINVVLLCFDISEIASFQNLFEKWKPEVSHYMPSAPIILVGTKKDLREDQGVVEKLAQENERPVSKKDGLALKDKIGAYAYLECSSKTREGVKEVFETATRAALQTALQTKTQKHKCVVL